ncbi:hypothetical protein AAF712_016499, partial [Marasmius tenuissimus]
PLPESRPSDIQMMDCSTPHPAIKLPESSAQQIASFRSSIFVPPPGSGISNDSDVIMELETFEMDLD